MAAVVRTQSFELRADSELRLEAGEDIVKLRLVDGQCEVFGLELVKGKVYLFQHRKFAVFTYQGARLEVSGQLRINPYVGNETPMVAYANTHAQLEARRDDAIVNSMNGPRVLIVGPTDSGKSTLARILLSYALRVNRTPLFADIDVGQGSITIPGAVACVALDNTCLEVETDTFGGAPIAFYYAHNNLDSNVEYYNFLVQRLANAIDERCLNDADARSAGLIVNTCGWVDGKGLDALKAAARALRIDVILVLGEDRLYESLRSHFPETTTIVKLPRSSGVVTRDARIRRTSRSSRIREYFYGPPNLEKVGEEVPPLLAPGNIQLSFDDVEIYKVTGGGAAAAAASALPVGMRASTNFSPIRVTPTSSLLHHVLGVVHMGQDEAGAVEEEDQDMLARNVAGFVYVVSVDEEARKFNVVAPCLGQLPSSTLLLGSIKWLET